MIGRLIFGSLDAHLQRHCHLPNVIGDDGGSSCTSQWSDGLEYKLLAKSWLLRGSARTTPHDGAQVSQPVSRALTEEEVEGASGARTWLTEVQPFLFRLADTHEPGPSGGVHGSAPASTIVRPAFACSVPDLEPHGHQPFILLRKSIAALGYNWPSCVRLQRRMYNIPQS